MRAQGTRWRRQAFMFSATFPRRSRSGGDFLTDYIFLSVRRVGAAATDVEQSVEYVEDRDSYSSTSAQHNR